jgi:recombination protein RecA
MDMTIEEREMMAFSELEKSTFGPKFSHRRIFLLGYDQKNSMKKLPKNLAIATDNLNKTFGKGTVMQMSGKVEPIPVIPTGSLSLDLALGVGGFPKGRIIEIYGPESSGKTTLAIHAIAEAQKMGEYCAFIDAEHAFDREYAMALGVDTESLLMSQPDNGEQALEVTENLIRSGDLSLIVIDSVAALTPKSEIQGEMGDSKMGVHARLMSQALRKLTGVVSKTNCCVIFINQIRDKIGVVFGSPETTTGGNALKFYASVRIRISRVGQPTKSKEGVALSSTAKVKIVKNKCAPPFRTCEFQILYGIGIDKQTEILDMAEGLGIIKKSGSFYSYEGTKMAQGKVAASQFLRDNEELADEIEKLIKEKL